MNRKSQSTGIVYTFGEALAVFHKIAAHASGLNHVINKGQTLKPSPQPFAPTPPPTQTPPPPHKKIQKRRGSISNNGST